MLNMSTCLVHLLFSATSRKFVVCCMTEYAKDEETFRAVTLLVCHSNLILSQFTVVSSIVSSYGAAGRPTRKAIPTSSNVQQRIKAHTQHRRTNRSNRISFHASGWSAQPPGRYQ